MPSSFGRPTLFVEPTVPRAALAALSAALDERGLAHERVVAPGGEGTRAVARAALERGAGYLVAVGGDAVTHDLAATIVDAGSDAVLGLAALLDNDVARTFGLDRPPATIARHLDGDAAMAVDAGVVECEDAHGARRCHSFVNVVEVGYGAELIRRAARAPRVLGRVGRLLAAYAAIRATDRQETAVAVAHTTTTVPLTHLYAANGQFAGGGMKVAPRALPDDGKLNVLAFTGPRAQVFTSTIALYRGEHLPDPQIVEYQSPTVTVAPPRPLAVAADGRFLGRTPATVSLRPRLLRLKI